MNPTRVKRANVHRLTDLPNVGESIAEDLRRLGIHEPSQLAGRCPYELYYQLCEITGKRQDPCVADVFLSITSFVNGGPARPWWKFTPERKKGQTAGRLEVVAIR